MKGRIPRAGSVFMLATLLLAAPVTLQAASETATDDAVAGQAADQATKDLESVPEPVEQARLETRQQADYGPYLTDREGMSLYLFAMEEPGSGDKEAGDALGQDVLHLGAPWYLVSPAGEKIEQGQRQSAPDAPQGSAGD